MEKENYATEEQLQADCYKWFHETFIPWRRMLFHVDNNSYNAVIGAKKKALGVVKGPSDLIFIADKVYFCEMKLPGKTQSDEQKDFQAKCEERNQQYFIFETKLSFMAFITDKIARWEYNH